MNKRLLGKTAFILLLGIFLILSACVGAAMVRTLKKRGSMLRMTFPMTEPL